MTEKPRENYEIVVIGGGHAGTEAALAAARMGAEALLLSMDLATIGQMSCNPAIGGLAKGQLVREIDALGGEMALVTDTAGIQFRMLNRSKGPAVWSPRAQCDRALYAQRVREVCDQQARLWLRQGTGVDLAFEGKRVIGVILETGQMIRAGAVVLTAGTFLNGTIHVGDVQRAGGRTGESSACGITERLVERGFASGRLKTGTPPRLDGTTIDFSKTEIQAGDDDPSPFSYRTTELALQQMPCFLTYTNPETHKALAKGFDRSPMFTDRIKGVGPRYCPSIEDKIHRFADRERHQIFLEPEGRNTTEYYVNGFSTSLPEDVQLDAIRTVSGLEEVEPTRFGYAVEYDYFQPTQLRPTLETKLIENLFFAGQINGTTGYEEAGAQGLMAGINAALKVRHQAPFVLKRSEAYIGVLIDDLVTKGTIEPYRMFTSRAEHRLLLRQDNADLRLAGHGARLGLVPDDLLERVRLKRDRIDQALRELQQRKLTPAQANEVLARRGTSPLTEKDSLYNLLKRPELRLEDVRGLADLEIFSAWNSPHWAEVREQVDIEIKYEGFIRRQRETADRLTRLEKKMIPAGFDFAGIAALSAEAQEKLTLIQPATIGQASRISGVSPADVAILLVHLARVGKGSVSRETPFEQKR